ncbi:MAG: NPCBM/NEW2 domain-containing protein [Verrucomicrobia bacterium]|nr:NPCBM/NEW2 domain-containing protein [Verrucomicrobiota bacterium]
MDGPRAGGRLAAGAAAVAAAGVAWLGGAACAAEILELSDHPELIVAEKQDWGVRGIDRAAHEAHREGEPLQIGDRRFSRGIGLHAAGSLTVWLEGGFTEFQAWVGLQPCGSPGSVVFRVWVDGEPRYDSGVRRTGDPACRVAVPIAGAWELRLEADPAGDGIACDMANWADARLVRSERGMEAAAEPPVNVAPFGRVMTSDPRRRHGTQAPRTGEFPAEDFVLESDLAPDRNGVYTVPASPDGSASIGIRWLSRRAVRSLELERSGQQGWPDPDRLSIEGWFGESLWQGQWQPIEGRIVIRDRRWLFEADTSTPGGLPRVWKVRWVWPADGRPAEVRAPVCRTRTRWAARGFQIELGEPAGADAPAGQPDHATVAVIDGEQIGGVPNSIRIGSPAAIQVRYACPSSLDSERTQLRIERGDHVVHVAIEDVIKNEAVYVPAYGVIVSRAESPAILSGYRQRIAGQPTVLDRVRTMPEQTLEQALARTHRAAQNEGPVLLSLACAGAKLVVERRGDLHFHTAPAPSSDWLASAAGVQVRLEAPASGVIGRELDGGWLPIPVTTQPAGGWALRQRTWVAPLEASGAARLGADPPSVGIAEFTFLHRSAAAVPVALELAFLEHVRSHRAAELARSADGWIARASGKTMARVVLSMDGQWTTAATNGVLAIRGDLWPGSARQLVLALAMDGGPLPDRLDAEGLRAATKRYWSDVLSGGARIETPEPFLDDLIRSSEVRCYIAARPDGADRLAPWIAAMAYGPLESEAHSVIRGMDFMGHHDFARRGLDYFVHRYTPSGYLTTGYTTFGTGWHLWTVGEHWQLTRDRGWLRANASELARVGQWIVRQIAKTRQTGSDGRPVRGYGLMPPGVLADWNVYAQHFCMNAYYAAGLRELGEALKSLGHPDAAEFEREGRALAEATRAAFEGVCREAPVVPLRSGIWVPFYPGQPHTPGPVARAYPGEDAGRSWAYNVELGAHQMVPAGVLAPDDPRAGWMMEHLEDRAFLESGWFDYPAAENERDWFHLGGFSKVQPYYCRNVEIYGLRDEVRPFLRSYFNSLASLVNREVLTFWEHFHHSGAWDKTHETGYFLHQTRTMLVQERGDRLWLAPFVPAAWLRDGHRIRVENAPTRFGPVGYRIDSHLGDGYIEAVVDAPQQAPATPLAIRLRHPEGRSPRGVLVDGRPAEDGRMDGDAIRWQPAGPRTVVRVLY